MVTSLTPIRAARARASSSAAQLAAGRILDSLRQNPEAKSEAQFAGPHEVRDARIILSRLPKGRLFSGYDPSAECNSKCNQQ
jgi:hypothetical protein